MSTARKLFLFILAGYIFYTPCLCHSRERGLIYLGIEGSYNKSSPELILTESQSSTSTSSSNTSSNTASNTSSSSTKTIETKYPFSNTKGFGGGIHLGFNLEDDMRAELELGYSRMSCSNTANYINASDNKHKLNVKSYNFFVNGYFDLIKDSMFVPYIMAGIGMGKTDIEYKPNTEGIFNSNSESILKDGNKITDAIKSNSTTKFIAQIGLGLDISIFNSAYLNLGYKLTSLGRGKFSDIVLNSSAESEKTLSLSAKNTLRHSIFAGISFLF